MSKVASTIGFPINMMRQWLPQLPWSGWVFLYLPLVLFLSFSLSQGYELQRAVFSNIVSDAPDIYSARYENGIAEFPTILEWLAQGLAWPYVLLGSAVAIMTLRPNTVRRTIISAAVWVAILYTLSDLVFAGDRTLTAMITNATANVIGGGALALLLGAVFVLVDLTRREFHRPHFIRNAMMALVLIGAGAAVSSITYAGLRFLYQPLPADLEVVVAAPAEGFYAHPSKSKYRETRAPGFTFIPRNEITGGIHIASPEGAAKVEWNRVRPAREFRATVRFIGDCVRPATEEPKSTVFIRKQDVNRLSISVDAGASEIQVLKGKHRAFRFEPAQPAMYWFASNDQSKSLEVIHFVSEKDGLRLSTSESLVIFVGLPLYGKEEEHLAAKPRIIRIQIDNQVMDIKLNPRARFSDGGDILYCHPIDLGKARAPNTGLAVKEWIITAVVSIEPEPFGSVIYPPPEGTLTVTGANGWARVTDLSYSDWSRSGGGYLDSLNFQGAVSDMTLDGRAVDIRPHDDVTVFGELRGRFEEGGQVSIAGKADAVWKNSTRLNLTRWENLPGEWRLALASGILAAFGLLGRWFWKRLSTLLSDDVKTWVA